MKLRFGSRESRLAVIQSRRHKARFRPEKQTEGKRSPFLLFSKAGGGLFLLKNNRKRCVDGETAKRRPSFHHHNLPRERNGRFACEPSVLCRAQTQTAKVQQAYDRADVFRQRLPRRRPFAAYVRAPRSVTRTQ